MKMMKRTLLAVISICFLSPIAWSEDEETFFDEKAVEAIKAFTEPLTQADAFSVDFTVDVAVTLHGKDEQYTETYELSAARPGRFVLMLTEGKVGANISSDGEQLTVYHPGMKRSVQVSAPASMNDLLKNQESFPAFMAAAGSQGMELLSSLLHSDPYAALMEGVKQMEWMGEEEWKDRKVNRIRLTQDELDWDILLSQEAPVQLLSFQPDYSKSITEMTAIHPHFADLKMVAHTEYQNWNLNPSVADMTFALDIPEGTEKVEDMDDFFAPPGSTGEDATSLMGQAAPDFTLPDLDGNEVTLSELKDYKLLILDFWATWCGPCVVALPDLAAVAEKYKEQGVGLRAVNLREDAERIRRFLENKGLELDVLRDADGSVAQSYLVQGIPQTVIIDEKGVVRKVHIGYLPQLKQQLESEIDALLSE